jgi:hypothetical protein
MHSVTFPKPGVTQPELHLPHFNFYLFLRSFPWNRTPLGSFPLPLPRQTIAHLKKPFRCRGAGIQLRQQASDKYLSYKFPSNLPGWKNNWFYIENHAPKLLAKSNNPPVVRPEWNLELFRGDMDQVEELLDIIEAHKMTGVTGASVMFSFFKRRVQPIQQRHRLGFEYTGSEDPSRMCAEELPDEAALLRVKRVLLDVDAVPYVPELFSA